MWIKFNFDEYSEEGRYFLACARIRNCSATALYKRLFDAVVKDQLVLSILDDDSKPEIRKGEQGFSERRHTADST